MAVDRLTTLSSTNLTLARVFETSRRIHDLEVQIASGKVAQTYSGIDETQARRLFNLETTRTQLVRFADNNDQVATRLEATSAALDGIHQTIADFRNLLLDVAASRPLDALTAEDLQAAAFRSLSAVEGYLNTEFDGQYLFAGNRKTSQPVNFGLTDLAAFQATYDGETVIYPQTRAAHIETTMTIGAAGHGGLSFAVPDTITAATAGAFDGLSIGTTITVTGTAGNDKALTVVENDGTTIRVAGTLPAWPVATTVSGSVAAEVAPAATITAGHWYRGDDGAQTHRVSETRTIQDGMTAIDPVFEKAIRAMGLIAQGKPATAGEFRQHPERADQALKLLSSALDRTPETPDPFGAERSGNIDLIERTLGFEHSVLNDTILRQRQLIAVLEGEIAEIENADMTEAVSLMTHETLVLEASYQTIARIRQLSLNNFL